MTLPVALSGTDVIGQAKTGTGKTLGFGLPILERVTVPADVEAGRAKPEQLTDAPQALVVVPTRELCTQVTNDLLTAGKVRNVRVLAIYGGRAYEPQVEALKKGVDVVVGTPGRLLDLAGQKKLDLSHVRVLVLDEADEMLDLGFLPDVEKIMDMLPAKRQTMLFSATMPGAVIGLARRYMSQPTHIRATSPDGEGATVANITQRVYRAHSMDKPELVSRILQARGRGLAMIFCRTKRTAADIAEQLERRGFASGAVHGDLGQGAREQALRAFRNGKVDVLVCTDVAARGIDVEGVTHVINYQTPEDEKTYLHRIGRTGRAGNTGTAITLVDWDDIPRWQLINKALELDFHDPVETYSTSPHLYAELDIPEGTKGILPRTERTRAGLDAEELEDLGEPGGRRGRSGRGDRAERTEERPARTRTPRQRRRTRGGTSLDEAAATTPAVESTNGAAGGAPAVDGEQPAGPRTPRRRRRTRSGGGASVPATATPVTETAAPAAAAPVAEDRAPAPVEVPQQESAAAPRRRRTRASAPAGEGRVAVAQAPVAEAPVAPRRRARVVRPSTEPEVGFQTVESVLAAKAATTAPAAAPVEEAPKAAPRRRTVKKAAEAPVTETAETVEETKPRRRTVKKAAEAPVTETAEPAAETKPRRRTVKKAAEAPVTETAETVEETKPRRRTVKKAAEAPVTETAEPAAETKPRRRTVKKAAEAPVTETAETVEETKPRRRTVKKAAEALVEAAAEAVAEAKPRRRTAKKAVAAEAPDASEPKTPRRRTTKKAAAQPES
ncbi:DEAD/DEAH box helicase [Streptomyces tritici]|uniref:DEAD/DEAH box helicase n=1 Tax=Streptomyces tritici TaxID=2054410 RepID=UPI003AF127CB